MADHDRILDLWHGLDRPVDLCRADPDSRGIEGRVRAAIDDDAALRTNLDEVAVRPDSREVLEVCGVVAVSSGVLPERHRHGRKRLRTDEFSLATDVRMTMAVPRLHSHAESAGLKLSASH